MEVVLEVEVGLVVVVNVVEVVVPPPPEQGRHCEYQALEYVQQEPETQVVAPVQP